MYSIKCLGIYTVILLTNWNFVLKQIDDFLIPAVGLLKLRVLPTLMAVVASVEREVAFVLALDNEATPLPWNRQLMAFFLDSAKT